MKQVLLTLIVGVGLPLFVMSNCPQEATILSFNSKKCGGCWGWTIAVGHDTIKTTHLPWENINSYALRYPSKVTIALGGKEPNKVLFPYYRINCIELMEKPSCVEPILYEFIGGKPNREFIEVSMKIAKKWGFTLEYKTGSCGNTIGDRRIAEECKLKSESAMSCLNQRYQANWKTRFYEEVELALEKSRPY